MAEVQTNEKGEGGKNKQKKQHIRVDFTPMVDMNMLLITFFMFATTLLKPQTMNINMPMDDVKDQEKTKVKESGAVTLLLGADDELYYYLGIPKEESTYSDSTYLVTSSYGADGIRKILLEKNSGTYEKIQELKVQLKKEMITDSVFKVRSREVQEDAKDYRPTVMIKPTEVSTYKNMVDALDEMLITNIGAYAIVDLTPGDRFFLYQRTGNKDYLTDEQKAELLGQKK